MAISFPTSLDNFTNPSSGNTLDSPSHSLQHSDINDAVEALEAKLGIGASPAGSATSGQVLTASTGGTTTWTTLTPGGLVQIVPTSVAVGSGSGSVNANGAVTFSGTPSISINGCFSASYNNYKVLVNLTSNPASDIDLTARLRLSGTDNSASNYNTAGLAVNTAGVTATYGNASNSQWFLMNMDASKVGAYYNASIDFYNPALAIPTTATWLVQSVTMSDSSFRSTYASWIHDVSTAFDGFSFNTTGNIAGTIRIYGYKN